MKPEEQFKGLRFESTPVLIYGTVLRISLISKAEYLSNMCVNNVSIEIFHFL